MKRQYTYVIRILSREGTEVEAFNIFVMEHDQRGADLRARGRIEDCATAYRDEGAVLTAHTLRGREVARIDLASRRRDITAGRYTPTRS